MTDTIKLRIGKKPIQIGFTDQRVSPLAGMLSWAGYLFQALVTSLAPAVHPLEVWRTYHGRAGIEPVIRELRYGCGLQQFCGQDFWATEAVLSMVIMAHNLVVLFERLLGWMDR